MTVHRSKRFITSILTCDGVPRVFVENFFSLYVDEWRPG